MEGIWRAAEAGGLAEVERLVGEDPGLLDARDRFDMTPLMLASRGGQVGVVRWTSGRALSHCLGGPPCGSRAVGGEGD
jgi:hypothetical protein